MNSTIFELRFWGRKGGFSRWNGGFLELRVTNYELRVVACGDVELLNFELRILGVKGAKSSMKWRFFGNSEAGIRHFIILHRSEARTTQNS